MNELSQYGVDTDTVLEKEVQDDLVEETGVQSRLTLKSDVEIKPASENRAHNYPVSENRVHEIDCLELLQQLPTGSAQCVFIDPPFNLGKSYNTYADNIPLKAYFEWTESWIRESMRVLSESGTIFVYNIPRLLTKTTTILDKYAYFRHWISWNSAGKPLGKTLQPNHYGILYYTKSPNKWKFYDVRAPHKKCRSCGEYLKDYGGKKHLRHKFGYLLGDVWDDIYRVRHSSKRIKGHPCQLPVHLIERLLLFSTDPNDMVIDLFAGGGSAGVAAKQLGRRYIGSDIDGEYVDQANEKIESTVPQKVER